MSSAIEKLGDVASMLEFQAKVALSAGDPNISIEAARITPQIVKAMREAAQSYEVVIAEVRNHQCAFKRGDPDARDPCALCVIDNADATGEI